MYRNLAQGNYARRALLRAGVLIGLLLAVPASAWALTYTFTTIDVLDASSTEAYGINNAGQIVGNFNDATGRHGFLATGGSFTTIDVPGNNIALTDARGINATGQIVGYFRDSSSYFRDSSSRDRGFLATGGSFTTIDVPGPTNTYAFGVNDTGQILGSFLYATGGPHGFLATGGSFTTIDVPGSLGTNASGINNAGQIVGDFNDGITYHGFLATGGSFDTIDVPQCLRNQCHGPDCGNLHRSY